MRFTRSLTVMMLLLCVSIASNSFARAEAKVAQAKATKASAELPKPIQIWMDAACLDCHDGPDGEGGLDLASLSSDLSNASVVQSWVRIHDRVVDGEMPPPEDDLMDDQQRAELAALTSHWIASSQKRDFEEHGRVRGRRLTNLQLERTLQDLLAIDVPLSRMMPEEPRTDGYTGLADAQSMSHFHLETHLQVVDEAIDIAMARVARSEEPWRREYNPQQITANRVGKRRNREPEMRKGLAVVWASTMAFYGRITPTTIRQPGWYRVEVAATAVNPPKVDGQTHGVWCSVRSGPCVSSAPQMEWIGSFEADGEPRKRVFEAWLDEGDMLEIRPMDANLKKARFRGGQVGAGEGEPQKAPGVAMHSLAIERIYPKGDPAEIQRRLFGEMKIESDRRQETIRLMEDQPKKVLTAQLRIFVDRAFRRPAIAPESDTESSADRYVKILHQMLDQGVDPIMALRAAYRAVLCAPRFVYFVEPIPTDSSRTLDSFAIATRLSYMLTGSMPDAELMQVAKERDLADPKVLSVQVDRLLEGDGLDRFVSDFSSQWLDLLDIDFTEPDPRVYRDFDPVVQHSMLKETHKFLATLIRDNAPAKNLIQANYTYLNSRLARFYELEEVESELLHRVELPEDSVRGGLLSQGAILKVTADGNATSPVIRGVWISERILGTEIPPAPENVPAVEPDIRGAKTIREQLQKHVAIASCAACHKKIDPPGYALENFDPSGQWRDVYAYRKGKRTKIDASFRMPNGTQFEDFVQFRDLVSERPDSIARNFAAQLLTYGTGAKIQFADRQVLDQIVESVEKQDYGLQSIIHAVVASPTFLSK